MEEITDERKISKQPSPRVTGSAKGPYPTIIQISRTPGNGSLPLPPSPTTPMEQRKLNIFRTNNAESETPTLNLVELDRKIRFYNQSF